MRTLAIVPLAALLLASSSPRPDASPAAASQAYALVVNANNPAKDGSDAARKMVKTLYLKDLTRWSEGIEAKPYGREARSAEQSVFLTEVLGMSEAELARHWLRLKNQNGTTPPKEVDSDRLLLKHVARHDGAFGVVKLENAKADGVRVLFEFKGKN